MLGEWAFAVSDMGLRGGGGEGLTRLEVLVFSFFFVCVLPGVACSGFWYFADCALLRECGWIGAAFGLDGGWRRWWW